MKGRRLVAIAVVIAIGVLIALVYGAGVGTANQVTYLVEPLRRAHVDLFTRDWFAMETTHYHGAFVCLATELFRADDTGATAFGIAHLVAIVATIGAIYALLVATASPLPLAALLVIAGWLVLGGGRSIGGSYVIATYFQPSSIATVAWLAALAYWLRERRFAAGIALAIGGVFHANFLLLGILWFGALELASWRTVSWRRIAALLGPSLLVLVAMLPAITAANDADDPALALRILVEFHAPMHYDARVTVAQLPALLGWWLAAWATQPAGEGDALAALFRAGTIGTAMCAFVFLAILVVPAATKLFVWRIAPFAQLASQIVVVAFALSARVIAGGPRVIALVLGGAAVLGWSTTYARGHYAVALTAVLVAGFVYRRACRREAVA